MRKLKLKISRFTIAFVYLSAFLTLLMWVGSGCGLGPTSYSIPDFYAPTFTKLSPDIVQTTDSVTVNNVASVVTVNMVRIKVTDNSGTPTVNLYARKFGTTAFTKYTMTAQADYVYSQKLPSDHVSFEYYFGATDGLNTVYYPATAPTTFLSKLVGVPVIYADKYYGISPAMVLRPGEDATFEVDVVSDTALEAGSPKLTWRKLNDPTTTATLTLTATADVLSQGVKYRGTLAAALFTDKTDYEYQISATNTKNSSHDPYTTTYPSASTYNKFSISSTAKRPPVAIAKYNSAKKYFITTDASGASDILLDGSDSYDPDDGKTGLTYTWKQVAGPTVSIKNSNGPLAYFTPLVVGTFSFSLQVQNKNSILSNIAYTSPDIQVTYSIIPSDSVPSVITTEIVLSKASSPFTVVSPITVGENGKLKIERGVTLKFETGAGIYVTKNGTINADGDSSNKIILTSNLPVVAKGQWEGIQVHNDSRFPVSTLNYCDITSAKTAIYIKDSKNPTVSNCSISECFDGVYSDNSTVTITQNTITGCGTDAVVCVNGSVSTVSNNTITKNKRYGINCNASKSEIAKNTVNENSYGIYVQNSLKGSGNVVNVFGNIVQKNTDGLRVEVSDPVVSSNDFSLNNDNGIICRASLPQITSNAIHNNRDSGVQMVDCNYRGGLGALANVSYASVYSCEVELANNVITFSGADGIELEGSNPIINHNIIAANANSGIYIKSYVNSATGAAVIDRESNGLLIINNYIGQNSRSGIARNGPPPDQEAAGGPGTYFANMSIMINNNNIYANPQYYSDVKYGQDLSGDTREIYVTAALGDEDTSEVPFTGMRFLKDGAGNHQAYFLSDRNAAAPATLRIVRFGYKSMMMLHAVTQGDLRNSQVRWNDGRNIMADPKIGSYASANAMTSAFEAPLSNVWLLRNIPANPRNGPMNMQYNTIDGSYGDVSLMINSGTAYSFYEAYPCTQIGLIYWIGTIYESLK